MSMFRTLIETMGNSGPVALSYLQSTGTQYIDANLPNYVDGFRVEFAFSMESTNSNQYIWGAEENSSYTYNRYYFKYANTTSFFLGTYKEQYVYFPSTQGTRYEAVTSIIRYESQYVDIDGVNQYMTQNNKNFARTSFTPFIFALNSGGSPTGYANIKLYYMKFYDSNNTLIRDFIPILDDNGTPCLYDRVSDTNFYNLGTGTFLYG